MDVRDPICVLPATMHIVPFPAYFPPFLSHFSTIFHRDFSGKFNYLVRYSSRLFVINSFASGTFLLLFSISFVSIFRFLRSSVRQVAEFRMIRATLNSKFKNGPS